MSNITLALSIVSQLTSAVIRANRERRDMTEAELAAAMQAASDRVDDVGDAIDDAVDGEGGGE
jgi:ribosome-binding protein aMBF1 (putative translation factor)